MRIALYQPDIPQNTGTILRLGACLGVPVDIIEPAGFSLSDKALKRAGLDYLTHLDMHRHESFAAFEAWRQEQRGRLVLLTTAAAQRYTAAVFAPGDILLLGRESVGVPPEVHVKVDMSVRVPMRAGMRSLNVAVAGAMVLGEALRQTGQFPAEPVGSGAER